MDFEPSVGRVRGEDKVGLGKIICDSVCVQGKVQNGSAVAAELAGEVLSVIARFVIGFVIPCIRIVFSFHGKFCDNIPTEELCNEEYAGTLGSFGEVVFEAVATDFEDKVSL